MEVLPEVPADYYPERDQDVLASRRHACPPDAAFEVKFFGRFEISRGNEAVHLGGSGKALTILKRLMARPARPVSQDHLMGWLWPESDLKRARWSLNSSVYALRGLLGHWLPSLPASETVLLDGRGYWLSPRIGLSSDVEEFDLRCDQGYRFQEAGRVPEAVAEYQKAVGLYRGDYLVEDLYESWTAIERERLLDAYSDLLHRLASYHLEAGQPREGVRVCYQLLTRDRCDEIAHRLLMRCFVNLGQRPRALRQFGLCARALGDDYGMSPAPETRALHARIRENGGP